ncbi:MAG: YicC family protein [Planctomycetes bacterium]|nr:YicC family protein [Planctomycetota bacterium]
MIRSMTGFGLGEAAAKGLTVRTEIRTVNHRFLQPRLRLPQEFAELEPLVDAELKKALARGAVTLTVNVTRSAAPTAVKVDEEVAKRYVQLLRRMGKKLELPDDLSLAHLAALPGVISTPSDDQGHQRDAKLVLASVRAALKNLVEMREVEGKSLEADLRKHAKAIAALRNKVAKRMPEVVKAHHENVRQRAARLMEGVQLDPKDLARELALLAEKTDVSEELARLDSHLQQLDTVLGQGGEVGRKLDFLVQEIYREANTIGSKANDAQVAHWVVDLKTHIERVREQVQNVE